MEKNQVIAIMAAILAKGDKKEKLGKAVEHAEELWEIVEKKTATKEVKGRVATAV